MKSKVTGISPKGATVARANGSAVNVGDDVEDADALTLTIPAGSSGGSVQFKGAAPRGGIRERVGAGILLDAPTASPMPIAIPALIVSDTTTPPRTARTGGAGGGISRGSPFTEAAVPFVNPPALKVQ